MTLAGWIAVGLYLLGMGVWVATERLIVARGVRRAEAILDEARRCNDDLAEALALARYGALDEAGEMATRWRARRGISPMEMSKALGAKVTRCGGIAVERRGAP